MILAAIAAMTMTAQAQNWATIDVGDWDNPITYNGSYFDMAPTNFYVAHTGAQILYTPDMLADMAGKQNVRIKGLTFMFYDETFEDITRNVKVYVQETDATEFAINEDGVKQFFPFGEQVGEEERLFEMMYLYGEDFTVPFRFDYPFTAGKGLLVTMVFDALDDDNCTMGSDYAPFYTSGIRGKAMTYTNNWTSFVDYAEGPDFPNATAMLGCGTNVDVPLTRIQYTYEDVEAPTAPVITVQTNDLDVVLGATEVEGAVVTFYQCDDQDGNNPVEIENPTSFVREDENYVVYVYAVATNAAGEASSVVTMVVIPARVPTAINELTNGKTIASVRYFNVAGQEMTEANGMTIVVTTYTDGTTSAAKVVK